MIPMQSWYVQNRSKHKSQFKHLSLTAWHSVTTTAIPSPFRTWTQFSPQVLMGAPLSREPSAASETKQGWYANAWCSSRPKKKLETIIQDISSRGARGFSSHGWFNWFNACRLNGFIWVQHISPIFQLNFSDAGAHALKAEFLDSSPLLIFSRSSGSFTTIDALSL